MDLDSLVHSRSPVQPSNLVNDRDHGPYVTVAAILCLIASLLFVVARLSVRWPSKATLGRDDYVAPINLAVSFIQSVLILAAVRVGLGRRSEDLGPAPASTVLNIYYASDLLFIISLCSGRLSVGLFLARLFASQRQSRIIFFVGTVCAVYGLTSFVLVAARTTSSFPANWLARWVAVSAMGSALDVAFLIYPLYQVWSLSMKRSTKIAVVAGFIFRLPIIGISVVRLLSLRKLISSSDYTFAMAEPEAWTQVEMHYNLIAAIIPCLRLSLRVWDTQQLGTQIWVDGGSSGFKGTERTPQDPLSSRDISDLRARVDEEKVEGEDVRQGHADDDASRRETENVDTDGVSLDRQRTNATAQSEIVVEQMIETRYSDIQNH